jgi:hemoglobin/transferrin/lactoferrin receptor protein
MAGWTRGARALLLGVSSIALIKTGAVDTAQAQQAPAATTAQAPAATTLDPVTVVATKTRERVIDTLAPVSTVRSAPAQPARAPAPAAGEQPPAQATAPAQAGPPITASPNVGADTIQQLMPTTASQLFFGMPGVWTQTRGDDPGTAINIRGLQDFGRVAVIIDGTRQNFQRTGHNADGLFYLEPEMLAAVDVVRGPVANIYGSGAIGGVVSFRTKDVEDVIKAGERWGVLVNGMYGSNLWKYMGSTFAGVKVGPNIDIFAGGVYREQGNYRDGNGRVWPNTGFEAQSGIGKLTVRPWDGHEFKLTGITYETKYVSGQPTLTVPNTTSIYDTTVQNDIAALRWRYSRPDDNIFDWDANVYKTRTKTDQTKIDGTFSTITGGIGDKRSFALDTVGFDANNTSRFQLNSWIRTALTSGGDWFEDRVNVVDPTGAADFFTPTGLRMVAGGFTQLKTNFGSYVETIAAVRYDQYSLDGGGFHTSNNRLNPKGTIGVTPLPGFTPYYTYAEGYRAPAITETLIAGIHPAAFPANFGFIPNPALRPEVGKNKELGLNLRYDDIFFKGDSFRGKANYYRNDLYDFIEFQVVAGPACPRPSPFCFQYQNTPFARLEGWEFETMYDAGFWFLGVAGSHVRGRNLLTGIPLLKVPPDQYLTTFGVRVFDRKLTLAVRWLAVQAKHAEDIPNTAAVTGNPDLPPTNSYNVVNLYAGYSPVPDLTAAIAVDNLFNVQYAQYMNAFASGNTVLPFPSPGVTVKGSLKVRFGG